MQISSSFAYLISVYVPPIIINKCYIYRSPVIANNGIMQIIPHLHIIMNVFAQATYIPNMQAIRRSFLQLSSLECLDKNTPAVPQLNVRGLKLAPLCHDVKSYLPPKCHDHITSETRDTLKKLL